MAVTLQQADLDFGSVGKIIRALMNPVASDPSSPVNGELWYNSTGGVFKVRRNGTTDTVAMMSDVTAGGVSASLWDAQSVVIAVTDNTPVAESLAASTVLGRRASGNITQITYANLAADLVTAGINPLLLNGQAGAYYLNRTNHTGSQAASTISDFATAADARITAWVGAAPGSLDTLTELAAALGGDANFAATVTTALGLRTKKFVGNYGNGTLTDLVVNHALATTDVITQVRAVTGNAVQNCQIVNTDANNVTVSFNTAPTTNSVRVTVIG